MSNRTSNKTPTYDSDSRGGDLATPEIVFADPVAYLAGLGLAAEIVAETVLPAAA